MQIQKEYKSVCYTVANRKAGGAEMAKKQRILLAEDHANLRELVQDYLSAGGFEVNVAGDGLEAWEAVQSGIRHGKCTGRSGVLLPACPPDYEWLLNC